MLPYRSPKFICASQYIPPKDYVNVFVACPMSGKFWPLQITFYSFDEDLDK
jgi:hypothetical protein